MPAVSFRAKLLLAMMLVVAGVIVATVSATHQSVEATYRALDRERFAREVAHLATLQETRLAAVRRDAAALVRSVRLIAAASEDDPVTLHQVAFDELRHVLQPAAAPGDPPPAAFFRFLHEDGRIVVPPDARAGLVGPNAAALEAALGTAARETDRQRIGYLAPPIAGEPTLLEVVVTPIVDPVGARPLGALAIGFPVVDLGAPAPATAGALRGGLWLDGRLYSRTIPPSLAGAIGSLLAEDATAGVGATDATGAAGREQRLGEGVTTLPVDGVPHRVFLRRLQPVPGFPPAHQIGLYSMAEALARERALRQRIFALGALALLLGFALSLWLSRGLSIPIRALVRGTAEVQRGNLDVRVPVRSEDELGTLTRSFNTMTEGLALKERYRNALDLVADRRVAEELLRGEITLGGAHREASILFCDIRGFTPLTEGMAPADVIALLNEHMSALTEAIHVHGGLVDKFVGDAVMAIFGTPRSSGADAADAARAAVAMMAARGRLNEHARHPIAIGIGIATGAVVAGCMGSKERLNYTVIGERVNLAARLCAAAGAMEILIDGATRERLPGDTVVEPLPALALKGFREPIAAYRLAAVAAAA